MWFLNPGRDALYAILNRILTPYVSNLDLTKFEAGLWAGHFSVNNLRLKKEALDKFRLPIDVIEGHLGHLTLNIPWANLMSKPAEIIIEDLYLLAIPSGESKVDLAEDEVRAQAAKQERIKNAEVLHVSNQKLSAEEAQKNQGVFESLMNKVINNLQVTVKNIHIRYEDSLSVPGHPFAVGITLAGFTAISTDDGWMPTFIQSNLGAIHKLAKLDSLAVYFNTDAKSMANQSEDRSIQTFQSLISHDSTQISGHQYILKPVTGEGRITINHRMDGQTPKIGAELLFDEIGFVLDDDQYRDAISMVDMYHFYLRQYQYRRLRPDEDAFRKNRSQALLKFAGDAILHQVHEKNKRWTWTFFKERKEDRRKYVDLFKQKDSGATLSAEDLVAFDNLERKLSYEDIRFYRSISRSQLRKEQAQQKKVEAEARKNNPPPPANTGWLGWVWGGANADASSSTDDSGAGADGMTDEQRKELYEAIDYDEKEAVASSFDAPKDALKMRVAARLKTGSFALRSALSSSSKTKVDIISIAFNGFKAQAVQRTDNLEATLTLDGLRIHDRTTVDGLYPEIIRMKDSAGSKSASASAIGIADMTLQTISEREDEEQKTSESSDPFFFFKFEHNPLDERADNAVTVKMKAMEIIYHRGYIEAIYNFLKPPESQLESVGALLNAANETFEGLRNQTRAGLEYALQTHKTVDIKVDMSAPIIIIPEDIKASQCQFLVLDAGHISIESQLVDKEATRDIQMKRNQQYTDEDFQRLESLMYDKFLVKLHSTQLLIGDDLNHCLAALRPGHFGRELHLLERINVDFAVHNSIVADASNLARFKISGKLPTLAVNISNTKYKGLMRLIDIAIPHFGDDDVEPGVQIAQEVASPPKRKERTKSEAKPMRPNAEFRLASGLFGGSAAEPEYTVDDDDDQEEEDRFFETEEDATQTAKLHQHLFEFAFQVETLQASLFKTDPAGADKLLAKASLERFALEFALAKFDMKVDIALRSISLDMIEDTVSGKNRSLPLITSDVDSSSNAGDLVHIKYARVQKESPEYMSIYEGIDQSVDIGLSTFIFSAAPEPVITLYDFIMSTFVSSNTTSNPVTPAPETTDEADSDFYVPEPVVEAPPPSTDKIRVRVRLTSVRLILLDGSSQLATLALSAADVAVLLRAGTLRVGARLGSLSLTDDSDLATRDPEHKQILSIEGDDLADFSYETFDPADRDSFQGVNSSVYLRSGALKLHFLEKPLHDIYHFLVKFARLKGLYDAATQAAVQRASEIQRMKFDVTIQSPILVFPTESLDSDDKLLVRLGKITAKNSYEGDVGTISASLTGINVTSETSIGSEISSLKIIETVDITANVIQRPAEVNTRSDQTRLPDTEVKIGMSDVKIALAQKQYCALITLLQAIPRVFASDDETVPQTTVSRPPNGKQITENSMSPRTTPASLNPEIGPPAGSHAIPRVTLDLTFSVKFVRLHLYDGNATRASDFKDCAIARFSLNDNTVRVKILSDGAMEAEIILQSFTMNNTRPGNSKFREIIPAQQNREQAQFMVLYTTSGLGPDKSTLILVTVDSPKIIFAIDPVFALLGFFMSAFPAGPSAAESTEESATVKTTAVVVTPDQPAAQFAFRVDLHDVSVSVLENDSNVNSQAIQLTVKQVLMSQQGILALTVNQLGMSLTTMGKASESARFLDDIDFTLSLDSRQSSAHQMTSIELAMQPIIFRASLMDVNLITSIVLRAINLYTASRPPVEKSNNDSVTRPSVQPARPSQNGRSGRTSLTNAQRSRRFSSEKPQVLMSKEKLSAKFEGFQLVLIGNMYQLPIMNLNTEAFEVNVKDWSGDLQATTSMATSITYWNLTNSHWEPLIDPWAFSLQLGNSTQSSGGIIATLASKTRLDVNVTATFLELGLTTLATWDRDREQMANKGRAGNAPYKIINRTGNAILVWHDQDGTTQRPASNAGTKLSNEEVTDWRFDDWKTMREHISSSRNNTIGVQFQGKSWEPLRSIPVDREGEFVYVLRPRKDTVSDRLLCQVTVKDNVKIVTLRSTYRIQNHTLYPLEVILVDANNKPSYALQKIAPGQDYSIPIDAVTQNKIKIRPDAGFNYNWSMDSVRWEDLIRNPMQTIVCRYKDNTEAPFHFQASALYDPHDPTTRKYPKITLQLRAPIEIENLLPFDLKYRIFDKNTNQNWGSFLRRGGIMPVHSVQLNHLVLLNIEAQDSGFKPSDFAIINTDNPADFEIEKQLTLSDKDGRKIELRLNYFKYPQSGGAVKVQIYSPYVLINHTGLPFAIRSGNNKIVANLTGNQNSLAKPTPFMFSHSQSRGSEFSVKIAESVWSKVVSFEAPSAETEVILESPGKNEEIHAGISWQLGLGKYKLTKVVTLAPRFIIKNKLDRVICFREHGVPPSDNSTLQSEESAPMQRMRPRDEKLLTVTFPGLNAQWSAPINMQEVGTVHLRVFPPGEGQQTAELVRADIAIEGATIFVTFCKETGRWPFNIDNDSDYPIIFSQSDETRIGERGTAPPAPRYTVKPHSSLPYAWDYPAPNDKKIRLYSHDQIRDIDILEIGNLVPFKFRTPQGSYTVSLDVRAEDGAQHLNISNYVEEYSLYRPRERRQGSLSRADTLTGSEAFETVVAEDVITSLTFNIDFEGVGLSLINKRMVEVVYLSATAIKFEYVDSDAAQTVNLALGSLQIDNQLHEAQYPIVLQPTPIPKGDRNGSTELPVIQASVMLLKDTSHGVLFIKYASVLLQAMTINMDEDFLFAVLDFSKLNGASWEDETQDILVEHPEGIPEPRHVVGGQELYFEVLELQPIRLSLSFMRTERVNAEEKLSMRNPLAVVVNALTMTLGNVNEAPLRLNALGIKDARMSSPVLMDRVVYHYRQEVLRQLYRILGSADFLGNPVGLFTNVSSGIADVFYEPYKGVVMHGNKELGIGIAKGAASLVKKTVFGLSDSMTKVTSSIGKGLSAATFDSEYQRQRRLAQRQNKPKHAIYGVTAGAGALASSFASGVEGVVLKPIEGAESGGAAGFFKGVGKGLIGAVAKPMVGVFDLASNVSEGIRNTTTVFDGPQRDRVRIPRSVPSDGILRPYSQREALGQSWLKDIESGRYRDEFYVAHLELSGRDSVILLTTSHILSFYSTRLRIEWDTPFSRLQGVTIEDTGIRFSDKAGREFDKFVLVPKKSKTWFFREIERVVKEYNAKRRIER